MTPTTAVDHAVPANAWDVLDGLVAAEAPVVSVIVVHYEQPADLARALRALERQSYGAELLDVIVVDDGSAEPPVVPGWVRLITLPDRGFRAAAARNAGAAAARGEVLCFLDADTSPEPGYIAALTRLPALSSDVVTVGRRRHADLDGSAPDEAIETAGPRAELTEPAWLRDAYRASRDLLDADHRSYRFVISAVLCCSRRFFALTGGFDERFDEYGGEDWEWANRAYRLGAVLAHVPSAVAWHAGPDLAERSLDRAELVRRKNAEALVLLDRIGVAARRDRGVRSAAPDVVVDLPGGSAAATLVCADIVLTALPAARVLVDDEHAGLVSGDDRVVGRGSAAARSQREGARVVVTASALFTVARDARGDFGEQLASATERVGVGALGWVELGGDGASGGDSGGDDSGGDDSGSRPLIEVAAARARHRSSRRPGSHGFHRVRQPTAAWALTEEPDLEAHLSGWGP